MTQRQAEYRQYLLSEHWKAIRLKKLKQSRFICEGCSASSRLHVHHLSYERLGNENLTDLMVLCDRCHELIHDLWKYPLKGIDLLLIRRATVHFLMYFTKNEKRKDSKKKARSNHGFNTLPNLLKQIVKKSKDDLIRRLESEGRGDYYNR